MKSLIVALGICACIALTASEPCNGDDVSHCTHEVCGGHTVKCVRNICTCVVGDTCGDHNPDCFVRPGHCIQVAQQRGCKCDHRWHCVDGHCACGFPTNGTAPAMRG